jgi:DNA-binding response OmpR family regulator
MLVLLVEDETDLSELIGDYLETEDMECDFAYNGKMACELIERQSYDVIVLDVMLPKMDGLTVCQAARDSGVNTPILMLTARDSLDDKLKGFASGANDYLVKPFDLPELVARIQVLGRQSLANHNAIFKVADLTINLDSHEVKRGSRQIQPGPIGWKLLLKLAKSSPKVVSRVDLEQAVWGDDMPNKHVLKTQLHRLRALIDETDEQPLLHTIKGVGVVLTLKERKS